MYIDVNGCDELHGYTVDNTSLTVGANTSLNALMDILKKVADEKPQQYSYMHHIVAHIDLVANVPVRNVSGSRIPTIDVMLVQNSVLAGSIRLAERTKTY